MLLKDMHDHFLSVSGLKASFRKIRGLLQVWAGAPSPQGSLSCPAPFTCFPLSSLVSHYSFHLPSLPPVLPVPTSLSAPTLLPFKGRDWVLNSLVIGLSNVQQVTMDCLRLCNSGPLGGIRRYYFIILVENIVFQMCFQICLVLRRGQTEESDLKELDWGVCISDILWSKCYALWKEEKVKSLRLFAKVI